MHAWRAIPRHRLASGALKQEEKGDADDRDEGTEDALHRDGLLK